MSINSGALLLIGGATDSCLVEFVRLAGGSNAHVAVIGHASGSARSNAEALAQQLRILGVSRATVLAPGFREKLPRSITAIYMIGGDQANLVRLLDSTSLGQQVRDAHRRGVLVAGTSAGAAAMPHVMIARGARHLRTSAISLAKGLCLLPNVVTDTHFGQRRRQNRLRVAVTVLDVVGFGMDEDTALLIEGDRATVIGAGEVWYFEPTIDASTWFQRAKKVHIQRFPAGTVRRWDGRRLSAAY